MFLEKLLTKFDESNFEKNLVALVTEFLVDQKFLSQACCQKVTKFLFAVQLASMLLGKGIIGTTPIFSTESFEDIFLYDFKRTVFNALSLNNAYFNNY